MNAHISPLRQVRYRVLAPPLIQWLLSGEPDVMDCVRAFASDEALPTITVAGPPGPIDAARCALAGLPLLLPTVCLHMRKGTDDAGRFIEVACTDEHLVELMAWQARARRRAH